MRKLNQMEKMDFTGCFNFQGKLHLNKFHTNLFHFQTKMKNRNQEPTTSHKQYTKELVVDNSLINIILVININTIKNSDPIVNINPIININVLENNNAERIEITIPKSLTLNIMK